MTLISTTVAGHQALTGIGSSFQKTVCVPNSSIPCAMRCVRNKRQGQSHNRRDKMSQTRNAQIKLPRHSIAQQRRKVSARRSEEHDARTSSYNRRPDTTCADTPMEYQPLPKSTPFDLYKLNLERLKLPSPVIRFCQSRKRLSSEVCCVICAGSTPPSRRSKLVVATQL
jgi:hypothetical protein